MAEAAQVSRIGDSIAAGSQVMSSRENTESHPTVGSAQHRMPQWLLAVLMVLGASGGGSGIALGFGAMGGGAVESLARDVERQDERIDKQDAAIEGVKLDQKGQHRWIASELIKQSRALARIAEKVGADVDVEVQPYQSGGM